MRILLIIMTCFFANSILADMSHQPGSSNEISKTESNNNSSNTPIEKSPVATPEDAKKLVTDAIEYLNTHDRTDAYNAFNSKSGKFCCKDTYIFAIDMTGNVLAHGGDSDLIGTNQYLLKDSVGKYFIQEFIVLMTEKDEGWMEYKWRNYESFEIESKLTYLKKYDNNLFLGCGIYYGD